MYTPIPCIYIDVAFNNCRGTPKISKAAVKPLTSWNSTSIIRLKVSLQYQASRWEVSRVRFILVIHDSGGLVVEQRTVKQEKMNTESDYSNEDDHEKIKRNLMCKLCFQKYRNTRDLSLHLKTHLKNNKKPFMCDYCPSR